MKARPSIKLDMNSVFSQTIFGNSNVFQCMYQFFGIHSKIADESVHFILVIRSECNFDDSSKTTKGDHTKNNNIHSNGRTNAFASAGVLIGQLVFVHLLFH